MSTDPGAESERMFADLTVIDLTTFVTGGFATLMLANQGADVIKVERPEIGDDSRYSGPPFVSTDDYTGPGTSAAAAGESPYFWTVNYGKRSIELNLKEPEGLAVLYDLVEEADVFVENYRPGTAERLGVDYGTLTEYNDSIIYCSISAFGETGPWSDRPGYDLLVQGMSGIMSVTGYPDKPPAKVGLPQTDLITAMWAAFGITGALYRRALSGEGERVELGMLDASLPWLTKQAGKVFVGEEPERLGSKDPVIAPYQTFPTADGFVNVACGNQKLWEEFCAAIGRSDLIEDERFETNSERVANMDALEAELANELCDRPTDEWVSLLAVDHGLPVGPVFTVEEALGNEQVEARGVMDSVEHPAVGEIPVIQHPINFAGMDSVFTAPPPLLGEHTVEILEELGYTQADIEAMVSGNVIPRDDSE